MSLITHDDHQLKLLGIQGRPFREGIRENSALYWGLVGAGAVAFCGATDFMPELNRWLQIVEMKSSVSRLASLDTALVSPRVLSVHVPSHVVNGPRLRRLLDRRSRLQTFLR